MLLLTGKQFHLIFSQVYLPSSQSIFQDRPHQQIVLSSIRLVHVSQTGLSSS